MLSCFQKNKSPIRFVKLLISFMCMMTTCAVAQEPEAVPGEYIVKLKPNYNLFSFNSKSLGEHLGAFVKSSIPNAHLVVVTRASVETQKSAIHELSSNALVEYVEPNLIYHVLKAPNDTDYAKQWPLNNSIANGIDIGMEKAWEIETGSGDVIVAIIDSGIDYNLPDLKDNLWTNNLEFNGTSGVDDDHNGYIDDIYGINASGDGIASNPIDETGHGTHCAGTIGATGNNGLGITGINWKVKIMALRFLKSNGEGTLDAAIAAIDYAISKGAKVMSNSWGAYTSSQALQDAIERANKAGIIFIAAAGNDGTNNDVKPMFPASLRIPNIISVAALSGNGERAEFSNWGTQTVHLGAPGVGVHGFWKDGITRAPSGTSMAAPFVSGVAALVLSLEPQMTHLKLKERLLKTSRPIASMRNRSISGGMINAYYALSNEMAPPDANDPENWQFITVNIKTEHPYLSKTKAVYEVKIPGAKQMALFFTRFDTEVRIDQVKITDKTGKVAHILSGDKGENFYSRMITGDTANIEFISDIANEAYGFEIIKAAYR